MINIQLTKGDVWEIAGERHIFEREMGSGFLSFMSERTSAPYQVELDTGEHVTPTWTWFREEFAAGRIRRLSPMPSRSAQRQAMEREDDYDAIMARDPEALVRQIVLDSLDRKNGFSKSDEAIRRELAAIWEAKPRYLAGKKPPSPSTVRSWLKARGQTGERPLRAMMSMSGRCQRSKRLAPSVRRRMAEEATAYWSDHKRSMRQSFDELKVYLDGLNRYLLSRGGVGFQVPVFETFRRLVNSLECYDTVATKWGVAEARKRFKAVGQGLVARRPLLLGAMDHTELDVHLVMDANGLRYIGCAWLTVLIDVHSRCIVGWVLSWEPPSIYSVSECIKRANRPKLWMAELHENAPDLVDIHGKFDEIIVDNGMELAGCGFQSSMTDVGTSVRWAPIASPQHKAIVERFFAMLNELLCKRLPGGRFPIDKLRAWGLNPQADAVMTLDELTELLDFTIGVYHQSLHSTLGEAPIKAWNRGVREAGGIQVIGDDSQLDKMIGKETERVLDRAGIEIFNHTYHDEAITQALLEDLAPGQPKRGRRKGSATCLVKVKYNPANIGSIHVWNPKRGVFQTLPCTAPEVEGVSEWQAGVVGRWVREEQDITKAHERELRCALYEKIRGLTSAATHKRIKRNEARLLNSPKVHEVISEHLRIEYAETRHDGMAPIIPTVPLAPERSDDHVKPTRPPRGRRKTAAKAAASPQLSSEPAVQWMRADSQQGDWEGLQ
ncbi:DDE-type integrase/transposase/recombinase [Brevundimonas sp. M20]|uniref:Mu transposase C-terminal domain-containing protein n=1 Tax=Brevundimonas sp. M20 TaxID=2591463 RepID=UPI0011469FE0|nr:DDE-type integrase/transposase/recombinase [Brevundimonas sp. M20]QDH74232.1 DDE-type integrase/transposase/recombinase [Brevundimonas sp. M20]